MIQLTNGCVSSVLACIFMLATSDAPMFCMNSKTNIIQVALLTSATLYACELGCNHPPLPLVPRCGLYMTTHTQYMRTSRSPSWLPPSSISSHWQSQLPATASPPAGSPTVSYVVVVRGPAVCKFRGITLYFNMLTEVYAP